MAGNIEKLYPTCSNPEVGQWYQDTPEERYRHVKTVLDRYKSKEYDIRDVRWFIKNAIVDKIYISKKVQKEWEEKWVNLKNSRQSEIWN